MKVEGSKWGVHHGKDNCYKVGQGWNGMGWDVWVEVEFGAIHDTYNLWVGQWWGQKSIFNFKEHREWDIESGVKNPKKTHII